MNDEIITEVTAGDGVKTEKFKKFCEYLLSENKKFNITAITDTDGVYLKHFLDSLCGKVFFESGKKVLEIGSGGGFPSVPLKIYDESLDFTLVEASAKKCAFLTSVKELLGFSAFKVENARAEDFAKNHREEFDFVTARAVANSPVLCELTLPCLKIGGKGVFYKNFSETEITDAERAAKKLNCELIEVYRYELTEVPGERCIIVVQKKAECPAVYPRPYNKILKKTL